MNTTIAAELATYAEPVEPVSTEPTCLVCGGPLVDKQGRPLPLPTLRGRMPVRARVQAQRTVCCNCEDCSCCGPVSMVVLRDELESECTCGA